MTSVLLFDAAGQAPATLPGELAAMGLHVLGAAGCDNLVQRVLALLPDAVLAWQPQPDDDFFRALEKLRDIAPRPLLVFTDDVHAEPMERALELGVQAWVVRGHAMERLRPLLQLAQARFRRDQALREQLRELERRFEERKLVDRAKGLLMRAGQLPEDEAFGLLRSAAMAGKLRVGQLSQQVIAAASGAEAVNRAGQLRMLSQRALVLQALRAAGIDAEAAAEAQQQALQRARDNLQQLQRGLSAPSFGDVLQAAVAALDALQRALAGPAEVARLVEADACAERLLQGADRLTAALQAAGGAPALHVVNLCGRQRMLSQRLAKQALLAQLLDGEAGAVAAAQGAQTIAEFEHQLAALRSAPLGNAEIAGLLGAAEAEWRQLLQACNGGRSEPALRGLAAASQALLALFERLTEGYERSLHALIGGQGGGPRESGA